MIQTSDTCSFDTDDKGTSTSIFGTTTHGLQEVRIIRGNDDRHNQGTQDIEDDQAIDKAPARPWDITSWSLAFTGSNGDGFWGEYERKARADKRSPESKELPRVPESGLWVAIECPRILPVAKAQSIMVGSTTEEEHDTKDNKS